MLRLLEMLKGAGNVAVSLFSSVLRIWTLVQEWIGKKLLYRRHALHHQLMDVLTRAAKEGGAEWALLLEAHNTFGPWHAMRFLKTSIVASSTNTASVTPPIYSAWQGVTLDFPMLSALVESAPDNKMVEVLFKDLRADDLTSLLVEHNVQRLYVRLVSVTPRRALFLLFLLCRNGRAGEDTLSPLAAASLRAMHEVRELLR